MDLRKQAVDIWDIRWDRCFHLLVVLEESLHQFVHANAASYADQSTQNSATRFLHSGKANEHSLPSDKTLCAVTTASGLRDCAGICPCNMRELLRQQIDQYKTVFNAPMPSQDQTSILFRLMILQGLLFGDHDVTERFVSAEYWEELSDGHLHVCKDFDSRIEVSRHTGYCIPGGFTSQAAASALATLDEEGFTVLPAPCAAALVSALHRTLGRLQSCGWPAPFLLIYDEAWLLVDGIWALYADLLGIDCRLEADLNVWALLTPDQE